MLSFYLLSAVQVVLESLPVSSSGHLTVLIRLLQVFCDDVCFFENVINLFFFKSWINFLHVPTALIVALFFFKRWYFLLINYTRTWPLVLKIGALTALADVVTACFYFCFHFFDVAIPLPLGFLITLFVLGSLRWVGGSQSSAFTWYTAFVLGIVQGCALLPGISRFAAVFSAACWLGFSRRKAFEITWLLQWPLIVAASMRSIYYFYHIPFFTGVITLNLLLVLVAATVLAYYALVVSAYLVRRNQLWWFSVYMIIPFVVSLLIT